MSWQPLSYFDIQYMEPDLRGTGGQQSGQRLRSYSDAKTSVDCEEHDGDDDD